MFRKLLIPGSLLAILLSSTPIQARQQPLLSILLEGTSELGFFAISTDPVDQNLNTVQLSQAAIAEYESLLEQNILKQALDSQKFFEEEVGDEFPEGFSERVFENSEHTVFYTYSKDHKATFSLEEGTYLVAAINNNPRQFVYPFYVDLKEDLEIYPKQIENLQLELNKVDEEFQPISELCIFESFADENCSEQYLIQSESSNVQGQMFFDLYDQFYLKESYAPEGYLLDEQIISITYDGLEIFLNRELISPFDPIYFINEHKQENQPENGEQESPGVTETPNRVVAGDLPTGNDSHQSLMAAFFIGSLAMLSLIFWIFKRKGEME